MIKSLDDAKKEGVLENHIYNADCLEVMKLMKDKCVDLVLTDPPYGIGADKGTFFTNESGRGRGFTSKRNYEKANWDNNRPQKEYFDEIQRVSKNSIIFGGNYFADLLKPSRGWIFWHKKGDNKTQGINFADGELVYTSFNMNTKYIQYTWLGLDQINQPDEESKQHPTQKPKNLMKKLILDYTKETDIILDPFLGSGTTAVAAKQLGRRFIGIEISEKYCEIARGRLRQEILL